MNRTVDLLKQLKRAVENNSLPASSFPTEDVLQCVRKEIEVNRCVYSEEQYEEILSELDELAKQSMREIRRESLLILLQSLILCTSMITTAIYELANKDYWLLRHKDKAEDTALQSMISYIDSHRKIELINYPFVDSYRHLAIEVFRDEEGFPFVDYKGKKMYFPKSWPEEDVAEYTKSILWEQDERSPHCYLQEGYYVKENDVVIDAGAAEGNFSLDVIDIASKVYLIEADREWVEALRKTFAPYRDKAVIIHGFVDAVDAGERFTIDTMLNGQDANYIKMDIEGYEMAALQGASKTIEKASDFRCAICSYHRRNDERDITAFLEKAGCETTHSAGYMCPDWTKEAYLEAEVRRGVIFGRK